MKFSLSLIIISTITLTLRATEISDSIHKSPEHIQREKILSSTKIIYADKDKQMESDKDSTRQIIMMFYEDQYRHFLDPHAPYFLFMSKDSKLAMGVGGVVRMRGWFDFAGSIGANGFSPYLITIPTNPTERRQIGATPAGTSLFFRIIGRDKTVGNYQAYIEANFNGYQHIGFQLKKAYISLNDWIIGYATTTLSDPAAEVPTIDGSGVNCKLSRTSVLVRWMHTIKNNWVLAAGIEMPKSQVNYDNQTTEMLKDWSPDIAILGQYQWDSGEQHIRLSAMLRTIPYRDLVHEKNRTVPGWGLQISSTIRPFYPLKLYTQVNGGKGYASYTSDLGIGSYDLINDTDRPGTMIAPYSLGFYAGCKYNFTPNIYACFVAGEMRYFHNNSVTANEYKYGVYTALNIFWEPTQRFMIGAEYLHGQRVNFSNEHASANRIDALVQFSF